MANGDSFEERRIRVREQEFQLRKQQAKVREQQRQQEYELRQGQASERTARRQAQSLTGGRGTFFHPNHAKIFGFLIVVGIITWREIVDCHTLPWPPRYLDAAIVFGILDIGGSVLGDDLTNIVAMGLVLAMLVREIRPSPSGFKYTLGGPMGCDHGGTIQPTSLLQAGSGVSAQPATLPV